MKRLFLLITVTFLSLSLFSQDFFRGDFSKDKKYVILVNPTAGNIGVVTFLLNNGILTTDAGVVDFVGVYHSSQEYDFSKSAEYIAANGLIRFHLHEVNAPLTEDMVYKQNPCSDDFGKIFENSAGIIFFGGNDIPPALYGEKNCYSRTTDPGRHYFEVSFLFHLLGGTRNLTFKPLLEENPDYMVTGFCLGLQSMNVAAGGTLYQDIPAQIYDSFTPETNVKIDRNNLHRNYWQDIKVDSAIMGTNIHPIKFTDNGFFGRTINVPASLRPLVYSSHHQALKDVAPCFSITALSDDGKVIEGIVHIKYPNVFSVQFHPEVSALYEDRAKVKFAPEDEPATLHSMLDKKSLRFHKKYWGHISSVIMENTK
ncbi:MAG: gamma-glutamyl-gamma-aminobutyrate hydrolase family protein [Bacteroidales bacterium]|jgi:putative glutamine amidotransferase|nr:gamma-glutamyl-gamma-aminobutyrate hydrolase family protein [Bacteroidales bacterium]